MKTDDALKETDLKLEKIVRFAKLGQNILLIILLLVIGTKESISMEGYNYKVVAMGLSFIAVTFNVVVNKVFTSTLKEGVSQINLNSYFPDGVQEMQTMTFPGMRLVNLLWVVLGGLFYFFK